jgi:hypothetical protein
MVCCYYRFTRLGPGLKYLWALIMDMVTKMTNGITKSFFSFLLAAILSFVAINSSYAAAGPSIKAKADSGGLIKPSGKVKVAAGQSVTFTIASKNPTKYELVDVVVNGQSMGPVQTYTFSDVANNQTIRAKFKKKTYTQTVINGDPALGKLTPGKSFSLAYGKTKQFVAKPAKGYRAVIAIDGVVVKTGAPNKQLKYKLKINSEYVISAFFINDAAPLDMKRVAATVPQDNSVEPVNNTAQNQQEPLPVYTTPDSTPIDNGAGNTKDLGIKLGWVIPSHRINGDPLVLSDIVGYEVYYTSASGDVGEAIPVSGANTSSAVVMVPSVGTYYFSISTVDTNGEKSDLSEPVQVVVN